MEYSGCTGEAVGNMSTANKRISIQSVVITL